jgi:hypothetical protein
MSISNAWNFVRFEIRARLQNIIATFVVANPNRLVNA